ncbi:hypothetical protein S40288_03866 [Stachybotrys chartarum IBT 40288]|nr:hypothetical protein S40288_03866 [Stachybotrys chartarum IBT 40288]
MSRNPDPIAIIGSACRFAGNVNSPSKLWDLLRDPVDVRCEIPDTRFNVEGFHHHDSSRPGHTNVKHSYVINEDSAVFDAEFFGIKPIEAKAVDPQQRWLVETIYEALETAGLPIEKLRGSNTSVYAGIMCGDYETMLLRDLEQAPIYTATGTSRSMASNRISYLFDWHGPSMTIDTACSSSLVALHLAVQTLRTGESDVAVVCGANLLLGPENYVLESKLNMLSPDGVSRMWDADANGYARGEGIAAVILKTVGAALKDGDHIESIVRETGINQDGSTSSITVPSAAAQEELIRNTYARAGLDPWTRPQDRPQYFEAHGTGTPTGDPIEAEAIHRVFQSGAGKNQSHILPVPLYVGSAKTVIGHTEGTAGLAGVLKASQALQHGLIPPNLFFNRLSSRVAPFYHNIEVVRGSAKPWPHLSTGCSRRASVNSFGFGGSNAHAVLESYDDSGTDDLACNGSKSFPNTPLFIPFVFSAASEGSLRSYLQIFSAFLTKNPNLSAHDLAWTLRARRSTLPHRTFYTAQSIESLQSVVSTVVQASGAIGVRSQSSGPLMSGGQRRAGKLLGIFTGQGAQYPRMGGDLIEKSPWARQRIKELEGYLACLPEMDRPAWSLASELLSTGATSRLSEASIAQPLCTAVQILIVDALALANIRFDIVVGHSSGEIAAAYAAGFLSARDAMIIAYFRGVYSDRAESPNGPSMKGGMLAVGTDVQDAQDLCDDEVFSGRLVVAAVNSSSSVTISGDAAALDTLEILLADEQKFHRRLRVDKAYHSPHMRPCVEPYIRSLQQAGVQAMARSPHHGEAGFPCQWISTVYGRVMGVVNDDIELLKETYWAKNMTLPVLFSTAVREALRTAAEPGEALPAMPLVVEVGPHPALRGPTSQMIHEILEKSCLYSATLDREVDAVTAISACLGFIWQHRHVAGCFNGTVSSIDLDSFQRAMAAGAVQQVDEVAGGRSIYSVLKGLPSYQWNHSDQYWAESRWSRRTRLQRGAFHPLLGHQTPDSSPHRLSWRNTLAATTSETWLMDHKIQGQAVFPAAGYISTALEAARMIPLDMAPTGSSLQGARVKPKNNLRLSLIEIQDLNIDQAITLSSETKDVVEVLIELTNIVAGRNQDNGCRIISTRFEYSAALGRRDDSLTLAASAIITVHILEDDDNNEKTLEQQLPPRASHSPHMVDVNCDRFYASLARLGYEYSGRFKGLTGLKRRHGHASCLVTKALAKAQDESLYSRGGVSYPLLIHPAELDSSLQSLILAYSYPGDGQLRHLHLPRRIGTIRANVALCGRSGLGTDGDILLAVDSVVISKSMHGKVSSLSPSPSGGFSGDVNIYTGRSSHVAIQVHQVELSPLRSGTESGGNGEKAYRKIFSKTSWVKMMPDGINAAKDVDVAVDARATYVALGRLAQFYMRQFYAQVLDGSCHEEAASRPLPKHDSSTAYYLEYIRQQMETLPAEGISSTLAEMEANNAFFNSLPDVRVMHLVGKTMPRVFRGETTMLEAYRETGVLDDYYTNGFSIVPSARWQSNVVAQIVSRHAHLNILEIGAGTGGTTKHVLRAIGHRFQSYTFTDISTAFLKHTPEDFSPYTGRVLFKALDIQSDPVLQGFCPGSYDVIIASFVLHATSSLSRTLINTRKLLRPGGFLVVGETSEDSEPFNFIFGPLAGWWLGRGDEGRSSLPHVSAEAWDRLLRSCGFSGIRRITDRSPITWESTYGVCLFVSQAFDDQYRFLAMPLSSPQPLHLNSTGHEVSSSSRTLIHNLTLLGGLTPRVSHLVKDLQCILHPFCGAISCVSSITNVDYDSLTSDRDRNGPATILSLVDLDKPSFRGMMEKEFVALKRIFQEAKILLWVTTGRRDVDPFSNIVVGFGRVSVHETEDLFLQHLDIENIQKEYTAQSIAEAFLRLVAVPSTPGPGDRRPGQPLWTVESEIVMDKTGREFVPRLVPLRTANDRYNSARYPVIRPGVDISKTPVTIRHGERGFVLQSPLTSSRVINRQLTTPPAEPKIRLRLTYATNYAIKTPCGYKFLVAGEEEGSSQQYLALVSYLASIMEVARAHTIEARGREPASTSLVMDPESVYQTALNIIAMSITWSLVPGQTIVVHNARDGFAKVINRHASEKDLTVVFIANDNSIERQAHTLPEIAVTYVSSFLAQAELRRILPDQDNIACVISLSASTSTMSKTSGSEITANSILQKLSYRCRVEGLDTLLGKRGSEHGSYADNALHSLLLQAYENAYLATASNLPQRNGKVIKIENLSHEGLQRHRGEEGERGKPLYYHGEDRLAILDLFESPPLPIEIMRLDSSVQMFSAIKTYWIVGLSGALGISLCDWMATAGARHIVLSSRNPQIEDSWINQHDQNGVHIYIVSCDITDYEALKAAHESICAHHPPISGVLNGAMVLRDTSIRNMKFTDMNQVLQPKVLGSLYLDQLFSRPEVPPLEFFILLSSINCVIGNQGQANYAAANMYQCALAASRRKRGLPGTAVNVGAIIGAGYLQKTSTRVLDLTVSRGAMMHLSEEDFHQLIAQAIESGRPSVHTMHEDGDEGYDEGGPELTTGLLDVAFNAVERPIWFGDAMFDQLLVHQDVERDQVSWGEPSGSPSLAISLASPLKVRARLQACQNKLDVETTIVQAFACQLRHELQVTTKDDELMAMRSGDIGVDSLISVDLRSWFLKAIGVSVPVLRIMSDEAMLALVHYAMSLLPQEIVPQLQLGSKRSSDTNLGEHVAAQTITSRSRASTTAHGNCKASTWDSETKPPESPDADIAALLQAESRSMREPLYPPQTIVLTGATGLLGSHLVSWFVDTTPATTKIICIAVRNAGGDMEAKDAEALSNVNRKVSFVQGDLGLPLLGLTQSMCAAIFAAADVVIHAGADTSHMKPYAMLRDVNVRATSEIARLCLLRMVPLHFVSSVGVGLFSAPSSSSSSSALDDPLELRPGKAPGTPPVWLLNNPSHGADAARDGGPELLQSGYVASKWVSERLLEQTSATHGLPLYIHRPSTIIRRGKDVLSPKAEVDWMHGLVKAVQALGAVPRLTNATGALDMVYPRSVCSSIAQYVTGNKATMKTNHAVVYVHQVGDVVVPLARLEQLTALDLEERVKVTDSSGEENEQAGIDDSSEEALGDCEVLPMEVWLNKAVAQGLHPAVAALVQAMDAANGVERLVFPKLVKE